MQEIPTLFQIKYANNNWHRNEIFTTEGHCLYNENLQVNRLIENAECIFYYSPIHYLKGDLHQEKYGFKVTNKCIHLANLHYRIIDPYEFSKKYPPERWFSSLSHQMSKRGIFLYLFEHVKHFISRKLEPFATTERILLC